ncbi:MAG: hypothetical protein ACMXYD_03555 [Candidatus Woesearchaeota archaeon]
MKIDSSSISSYVNTLWTQVTSFSEPAVRKYPCEYVANVARALVGETPKRYVHNRLTDSYIYPFRQLLPKGERDRISGSYIPPAPPREESCK